ncbi:TetR/AcrR family transcriptional regulator [Streptococcus dentiloxodontae]
MVSEKVNQTKERIIAAAEALFQEKSYQEVGVREIAKRAGCSHTTLYLYFKNKDEILYEVAHVPLELLYQSFAEIVESQDLAANKLLAACHCFIRFGFQHVNSYQLLFMYGGERVDLPHFAQPINELRMKNFNFLRDLMRELLPHSLTEVQTLNIVRGVYLFLHGMVMNYATGDCVYDERLQEIVTDYITYTIIERGN